MKTLRMIATRVVKLGGSLLDWTEWPEQVREWLAGQATGRNILIAGGGKLADVVRRWDREFGLVADTAHWLAVDAMGLTAHLAARLLIVDLLDDWDSLVAEIADASRAPGGPLVVFDARSFLRRIEPEMRGRPLPHSWEATSDSIAARVAECLAGASGEKVELVLLKSALPPGDVITLEQAAQAGYVDAELPQFAGRTPSMRCVNLRAAGWPEWIASKRA